MEAVPFNTTVNRLSIYYSKPDCFAERWDSKSTGLSVITNITAEQFNDREAGPFRSGKDAWAWARRISRLTMGA